MKLALFADVHSNLEALEACLDDARRSGAERHAFVGDLVGYGADPVAVLDLVAGYADRGAVVVRGNHDAAAIAPAASEDMNKAAEAAVEWTRAQLSERHRRFLAALPLLHRESNALFVHASAEQPEHWTYVTDATRAAHCLRATDATYVFCGHVHEPVLYYTGSADRPMPFHPVPGVPIPVPPRRRWLAVVGSTGQPRDGNTAACWALCDFARSTITWRRVPYDWPAAAAKIRAAGLPERLAIRLGQGK
jgi:diadenosine tetraphosphatase ApaH/serine/threonine PP2A family protein phosphatase